MAEHTFTYVLVPAEDGEPVEEISVTTTQLGDALPDLLQPRFAGGSVKNADGLRAEYGAAVDAKMSQLNLVAARGSVEVFALVRPSETTMPTPHAGTYFYFDEMGVLKDLPVNRRAAQIAASCGLDVESPFLGNIFIGRVATRPSPVRNVSFAKAELDSSSSWLRSAPSENAQYQMAMAEYEKAAKAKTAEGKERAGMGGDGGGGGGSGSGGGAAPSAPGSFKWAQTTDDVEVTVALPEGTGKKQATVDVSSQGLRISLKGSDAPPLVDIRFYAPVRPDESTWTFATAGGLPTVTVMAEKQECVTWTRLEAASDGQIL